MKRLLASCMAVAAVSWPAYGQRVETAKPDPGQIIHVQTALDHLTVLEMSEPVSAVAVGSSSFRVEWRGKKVLIEPTEPGVATNLFVWTPSGRFNYELSPAGAVPQMVFAVDQPTPNPPKVTITPAEIDRPADPSPEEILMEMTPVELLGRISERNRIVVRITGLLRQKGQVLILYSIRNGTNHVYMPGTPQVATLKDPRYRHSFYTLRNFQLSPGESSRVKISGVTPALSAGTQIPALQIKPGEAAKGIVALKLLTAGREPSVIELNFLAGPDGPVSATLVL